MQLYGVIEDQEFLIPGSGVIDVSQYAYQTYRVYHTDTFAGPLTYGVHVSGASIIRRDTRTSTRVIILPPTDPEPTLHPLSLDGSAEYERDGQMVTTYQYHPHPEPVPDGWTRAYLVKEPTELGATWAPWKIPALAADRVPVDVLSLSADGQAAYLTLPTGYSAALYAVDLPPGSTDPALAPDLLEVFGADQISAPHLYEGYTVRTMLSAADNYISNFPGSIRLFNTTTGSSYQFAADGEVITPGTFALADTTGTYGGFNHTGVIVAPFTPGEPGNFVLMTRTLRVMTDQPPVLRFPWKPRRNAWLFGGQNAGYTTLSLLTPLPDPNDPTRAAGTAFGYVAGSESSSAYLLDAIISDGTLPAENVAALRVGISPGELRSTETPTSGYEIQWAADRLTVWDFAAGEAVWTYDYTPTEYETGNGLTGRRFTVELVAATGGGLRIEIPDRPGVGMTGIGIAPGTLAGYRVTGDIGITFTLTHKGPEAFRSLTPDLPQQPEVII